MAKPKTVLIEEIEPSKHADPRTTQELYVGKQTNIRELETEIKELEEAQRRIQDPDNDIVIEAGQTASDDDEPKTADEILFKKRYGDLRAYSQKKESELKARITELEKDIVSTEPQVDMDLEDFKEKYPDVFKAIEGVVEAKSRPVVNDVEEMKTKSAQLDEREAQLRLLKDHPDLEAINAAPEFITWMKSKPIRIKENIEAVLFESGDVETASEYLTQFKKETGFGKKTQGRSRHDSLAAEAVRTSGAVSEPNQPKEGKIWKESEIAKLNPTAEQLDDIILAQREGRIINDMNNVGHR
jgi:hypothetical protein